MLFRKKTSLPLTLGRPALSVTPKFLNFFLNFCRFTRQTAQIIQLRSSNFTLSNDRDGRNFRGMKGIGFFYAYAIGNVAYGERFGNTAVAFCNYDAFKVLNSFLTTFDNFIADLNRVAYLERRDQLILKAGDGLQSGICW